MSVLKSLHENFVAPKKKQKLLGVVIDATRPYKTDTAPDFTTKLKIVDESLNCTTGGLNNPKKYIHVFIFSKSLETTPDLTEIGDIIYLKHFDLELYPSTNEIKAKKRGNFSKFYLFKGNPSEVPDVSIKATDDPEAYLPKPELVNRIQQLRRWSRGFFRENSLMKMNWYGGLKMSIGAQSRDFDMILRLKSVKNTNKEQLVVLEMTDSKNQSFFLQYPRKNEFKIGDVMKIRSVQKIEKDGDLFPNSYSSVLRLPGYSYDVRNFDREFAYEIVLPEGVIQEQRIEEEKKMEEVQDEYNEETAVLSTTIKKTYDENEKTRNVTEIKEILGLVEDFKQGKITPQELKSKVFRIRCYLFDLSPEEMEEALKFLCLSCKAMGVFKLGEVRHCCNVISKTVWQIKLAVKDVSIEDEAKHLDLYICDFDGNGSEIFRGIRTSMVQNLNYDELAKKYRLLTQQILDLSSIDYLSEFIIEPLIFDKEVIFRIIDTKFNQQ